MKILGLGALACMLAIGQTQPLLPENSVTRVSDHVYAIQGWPNVGIIVGERATLSTLQSRALELKHQGTSADDAGKQLTAELKAKYPDWENLGPVPNVVKRVYAESQ